MCKNWQSRLEISVLLWVVKIAIATEPPCVGGIVASYSFEISIGFTLIGCLEGLRRFRLRVAKPYGVYDRGICMSLDKGWLAGWWELVAFISHGDLDTVLSPGAHAPPYRFGFASQLERKKNASACSSSFILRPLWYSP